MKLRKSQIGVTLLEVMLVLAITGLMTVVSIRIYRQAIAQQAIENLRYDVDTLFQGLTNYYRANCSIFTALPTAQGGQGSVGSLLVNTNANVNIAMSTLSGTYIPSSWVNLHRTGSNQIVDNSAGAATGYIVQFNLGTGTNNPASVNTNCSYGDCNPSGTASPPPQPTRPNTAAGTTTTTITQGANETIAPGALVWREQVSVLLKNTTAGGEAAYKAAMGADCLSSLQATGIVYPCSSNLPGPYLVWERLPSFASPEMSSVEWPMMPMLKEFNLQYTHDQMMELTPAGYVDTSIGQTGSSGPGSSSQAYYLCGG